jgi:hypothetical protein
LKKKNSRHRYGGSGRGSAAIATAAVVAAAPPWTFLVYNI